MAICWCRLSLLSDSQFLCWKSLDCKLGTMLLTTVQWRLPVAHVKIARVLSSVHTISTCSVRWTSPCAACFINCRPVSQFVHTCVLIFWPWGSVTFWWQLHAFNCSMFCTWTRSGSPYTVVHSSSAPTSIEWMAGLYSCKMAKISLLSSFLLQTG